MEESALRRISCYKKYSNFEATYSEPLSRVQIWLEATAFGRLDDEQFFPGDVINQTKLVNNLLVLKHPSDLIYQFAPFTCNVLFWLLTMHQLLDNQCFVLLWLIFFLNDPVIL